MATLVCDEPIELSWGQYSARLAPSAGGRVASLTWSGAAECIPLLVEWDGASFDEHQWPKAGAFPMLPFANRLPSAGWRFGTCVVHPDPGPAGFALHGHAHRRPWTVLEASSNHAVLQYAQQEHDAGWPWRWSALQTIQLGPQGLTVVLTVQNDSNEAMPLAMGWHPYHQFLMEVEPHDLKYRAAAWYELDAEGAVGSDAMRPASFLRRAETVALDGWNGRLDMRAAPNGNVSVICKGAARLVLHRPAHGEYLCAEPVTVLPVRLAAEAFDATASLGPGASRKLSWTCGFKPFCHRI